MIFSFFVGKLRDLPPPPQQFNLASPRITSGSRNSNRYLSHFQVSYMTILDVYSFSSCLFVYLALAEYAVVLLIEEKIQSNDNEKKKEKKVNSICYQIFLEYMNIVTKHNTIYFICVVPNHL